MIDQKIAIVGGTGKFGQHLGERLEAENEIVISGSSVEKAQKTAEEHGWDYGESQEIVADADIVIVAVPISVTVDTINDIGPSVPEDALLCDITSIKEKPVEAMKQYSDEVLGMHPMYAPSNSIEGQKVVLCPEKGQKWTEMEEFWIEHGAEVHVTEPEEHDRAMSLVQGLMHFSELVIAETIRKSGMSEELENYSSPVYELITDLTARMLNQKPGLYRSIQSENDRNEDMREEFIESAQEMDDLFEDREAFDERFEELGELFDLEESQERTDELIEFMRG